MPQSFRFEMFDSIQCPEMYSNVYVFDLWETVSGIFNAAEQLSQEPC